jgi:hypothetical protein
LPAGQTEQCRARRGTRDRGRLEPRAVGRDDAIIVGLPYRKRFGGDFEIGDTIPYVFQNAPCQVIVAREPVAVANIAEPATGRRQELALGIR